MASEREDKPTSAWKSWALRQTYPDGLPVYKLDPETQQIVLAR